MSETEKQIVRQAIRLLEKNDEFEGNSDLVDSAAAILRELVGDAQ